MLALPCSLTAHLQTAEQERHDCARLAVPGAKSRPVIPRVRRCRLGDRRRLTVHRKVLPMSTVCATSTVLFPPYSVVFSKGTYDVRLYSVYPVVQCPYTKRDEGYLALGNYMDGRNGAGLRFAETQPIVMTYYPEGHKTMQLYIAGVRDGGIAPARPPLPDDSACEVAAAGGELVAVMRFEGNATPQAARRVRSQLVAALEADGLRLADEEAAGKFRIAQYGPLFSLATRLNEMLLAIRT